jgi:hypothetical protein
MPGVFPGVQGYFTHGIIAGNMSEKPSVTLPGTVEKVIKPFHPSLPEQAQISVEGADDLYKEIRVENKLTAENGEPVKLVEGAQVEVIVEANKAETVPADEEIQEAEEKP